MVKNGSISELDEKETFLADLDDCKLYYELRGKGPLLTIVNNFFTTSRAWRNFTRHLIKQCRILTYDLRGQGDSVPYRKDLDFNCFVEDLRKLLDILDVQETYLLGSSTSTLICREFCNTYPERIKGLILVAPIFCPYGSQRRKYLIRSWLNSLEKGSVQGLFDHLFPLVYSDRTIENGGVTAYLALRERFLALHSYEQLHCHLSALLYVDDCPTKLGQIQCPTLFLTGEGDFLASPMSLGAMCKLVPQAKMQTIDFAGHAPYLEATDAFERAVQKFIAEVEGP